MLQHISAQVLQEIQNPVFKENAKLYLDIADDFKAQVEGFGLGFDSATSSAIDDELVQRLESKGVTVANDRRSFHLNWISPSCLACRKGVETATYLISTQCQRDCFFCFNTNQSNYEQLRHDLDDPAGRLEELHKQGVSFKDLALTGGEPLLHKAETLHFFQTAARLYPDAYTRLYTNGDLLDDETLRALAECGLKEIRFSIKTDDSEEEKTHLFERMTQAKKCIDAVVVEMPVMPDEFELMQDLLVTLDTIGISGINLLELCFPFNNANEYTKRGYLIKNPPFRVLYNYSYGGGLPIAGSEETCLALIEFAAEKGLELGVHYCSLENKFTGQIFLQNYWHRDRYDFCTFSERDYFIKSAKVFGDDVVKVSKALAKRGLNKIYRDREAGTMEFPLSYVKKLSGPFSSMELGISYHVVEGDERGYALRELCLARTTPATFDLMADV